MNGDVALGVSGLRQFQPKALGSRRPPPPGWWVVKYYFEERIFPSPAREFGLALLDCGPAGWLVGIYVARLQAGWPKDHRSGPGPT
jgi:hypothetical protein